MVATAASRVMKPRSTRPGTRQARAGGGAMLDGQFGSVCSNHQPVRWVRLVQEVQE